MIEFNNLDNILNSYKNIIISAHVNPDGDAVAACTALALALNKLNKNICVLLEDYGNKYSFLPNQINICHNVDEMNNFKNELFISLDCGDKFRLGDFKNLFNKAIETVNIDHHITNDNFAKHNYVFEKSSTCEIIYELLIYLNIELDNNIAKALYTGIVYDTGGFRHSNTTSRTHQIVSELIKYEFPSSDIFKEMFDIRSYKSTKLLGRLLNKIEMLCNNQVAYSCINQHDLKEFDTDSSQTGGFIDYLRNIEGVKVAVFIYQSTDNSFKISMRSDGDINISKIATEFGGGGHLKACGCTLNGSELEVKQKILDKIKLQYDKL